MHTETGRTVSLQERMAGERSVSGRYKGKYIPYLMPWNENGINENITIDHFNPAADC